MISILPRIMHHLSRPWPAALELALDPLADIEPEVFVDKESRGPWWNARRCWIEREGSTFDNARPTHILVVHDDAIATPGLAYNVRAALTARPDEIVSFYSSQPQYTSLASRALSVTDKVRWAATDTGCCGLAVCMPIAVADAFVHWCDANIREDWRSDDTRIALFAAALGSRIFHTVPALFQHPPDGAGVDGGANQSAPFVATGPLDGWGIDAVSELIRDTTSARVMELYIRARRSKFNEAAKAAMDAAYNTAREKRLGTKS